MTPAVMIVTDFSDSSMNAINYGCMLARTKSLEVNLVNIFTVPATYTGEGMSLVTINDVFESSRNRLKEEYEYIRNTYSDIKCEARIVQGTIPETIQDLNDELNPE